MRGRSIDFEFRPIAFRGYWDIHKMYPKMTENGRVQSKIKIKSVECRRNERRVGVLREMLLPRIETFTYGWQKM